MMNEATPETSQSLQRAQLPAAGVIYSYTVVLEAPEGYEEQAPYIIALVQLNGGPMISAQLTDLDGPIAIGDPVEMVTRKLTTEGDKGMLVYGYKFRPLLKS
jgi:uncharacterized OB-fold protein